MQRLKFIILFAFISLLVKANGYLPEFRNYSIDNGLSQCYVPCIEQDKYGFMWFGTYDGLNRFDGVNFKVFRRDSKNPNSLYSNFISALYSDNKTLWIGTRQGLNCLDLGTSHISKTKFYNIRIKKEVYIDKNVSTILEDRKQQLYVGTDQIGLLKYDRQKKIFLSLTLETLEKKEVKNYSVDAAAIDNKNRLFVAVEGYGLCVLSHEGKLIVLNSTVQGINSICYNRGLYVGGIGGLYLYNEKRNLFEHPLQQPEIKGIIHHLFSDAKGVLWIGTETNGIVLYNPQTKEVDFINSGYGNEFLSSSSIYCIYQDHQKGFWIGTMRGGVDYWNPYNTQFHSIQNQLGNVTSLNVINTFVEIDKNIIWIGTDGSGIQQFDRHKNRFTESVELEKLNQVSGKAIIRLIKDRDDNVWICSYGWGITKYNLGTKRIDHYDISNSNLKSNFLWSVFQDKQGTIWIGSLNNAYLMHYDKLTHKFIENINFPNNGVITINETCDRKLMVGTYKGAYIYDPNARRLQKLNDKCIASMYQDKNANIWLGTEEDGLKILNIRTGVITDFDSSQNFIKNEHIKSILEDDGYNIWITTNNGLYCYNYKTGQKASYYKSDGLQSNQFTNGSVLRLSDGVIFWGGINGITILNPAKYNAQKYEFNLVLLDVKIMNKSLGDNSGKYLFPNNISEVKKIEVAYNEAYIGFDFIAISYPNSAKTEYAYFLEGVDKDWNYVGNNRSAYYSKLKEGEYTFRVKNTDNMGKWSDKQLVVKVKILPPFYRTWWAYLIYIILTMLIIRSVLKFQNKQNLLKQNILMSKLKEQQNLELIQMKEQFFTNISHELRTPLTLIIPPLKDALSQVPFIPLKKTELSSIFSNASRLLSLINQLLLFRKNEVANSKLYI